MVLVTHKFRFVCVNLSTFYENQKNKPHIYSIIQRRFFHLHFAYCGLSEMLQSNIWAVEWKRSPLCDSQYSIH